MEFYSIKWESLLSGSRPSELIRNVYRIDEKGNIIYVDFIKANKPSLSLEF